MAQKHSARKDESDHEGSRSGDVSFRMNHKAAAGVYAKDHTRNSLSLKLNPGLEVTQQPDARKNTVTSNEKGTGGAP